MAKFPIIEYEQLSDPYVKAIYEEIQVELGFGIVPNLFKSMTINPEILEANWKKFRSTILKGDVPRTLKEMLGIAISQFNSSPYALNVHLPRRHQQWNCPCGPNCSLLGVEAIMSRWGVFKERMLMRGK